MDSCQWSGCHLNVIIGPNMGPVVSVSAIHGTTLGNLCEAKAPLFCSEYLCNTETEV